MQKDILFEYLLQLGDNALILGHRLSECCGHGPELEIDMALTNIALDLTGQARTLYQRAAELEGKGRTEDDLAYLRDGWDFKNALLLEQPNTDFAFVMVRQFLFDSHNFYLHQALAQSKDEWLTGFATKSLKEITYHLRFSSDWVVRLGDGTEASHQKMQYALDELWMFSGELSVPNETERQMAAEGIAPDLSQLKLLVDEKRAEVLAKATLKMPPAQWMQSGGKEGKHTEQLGYILAEMQYLQRAYPGLEW